MSCPADTFIVPAAALSSPSYINACTAVNITSNSAAQSALTTCCGSAPVTVIMDGCYSYCNVTSSADQQTFERCFKSSSGTTDVDYACTLDDNPLDSAGTTLPASAGSTYLGGSSGTLVFPSATDSSITAATTTGTVTTTAVSGQATAKSSTSGKTSASATSSGATASSTANAGQPTVKQFSKGAAAILALAFVGLWA
ncbi:hypothetical protein SBOR_6406 [Sclerotinia borealis F-4128]|uniref:Uncharacterized protein n=1 Tax=Sclerotinia borealis (strain F-4128) TaxID=1432307 RepID=W9CF87_SCLBF|nr:hypothetical protein SBOR_6406 [Sclerotinia borealis F-4128]